MHPCQELKVNICSDLLIFFHFIYQWRNWLTILLAASHPSTGKYCISLIGLVIQVSWCIIHSRKRWESSRLQKTDQAQLKSSRSRVVSLHRRKKWLPFPNIRMIGEKNCSFWSKGSISGNISMKWVLVILQHVRRTRTSITRYSFALSIKQ